MKRLLDLKTEKNRLENKAVLGLTNEEDRRLSQVCNMIDAIEQEERVGPHFCPDWDYLELKPGCAEFAGCSCKPLEKK